jgi:D-alanyl-lipoteichoic acid acyltransferase DltB (MBOAT superfamily)
MILTSWPFAAFVAVTMAAYFALPRRGQIGLLLAASYVFYATWSWHAPLVLLAATAANHAIGRRLWDRRRGGALLAAGISLNVLALLALKYGPTPEGDVSDVLTILLPVGFSYRVLENIAFLVDASRRQLDGFPRFLDYALFASYFPKLLSGPIERGRAFLGQLSAGRVVDNDRLARAGTLIAVGAFRKLVLADGIRALMPATLFTAPAENPGLHLVAWLLADVFVIYNDFAGYTNLVRGVSALFGLELSRNFSAPFFARNFSELWMRWHMSLSFWLRDYVFLPSSRALLRRGLPANGVANLVLPPLAAMLVSALWHGISWNLLAWGALWGVFLMLARLPSLWGPVVPPDRRSRGRQVLGTASVWLMLAASTVLFQADLATAGRLFASIPAPGRITPALLQVSVLMAVSLTLDWIQHRAKDETIFVSWPLWARSAALAAVALAVFLATRFDVPEPFIYQNF